MLSSSHPKICEPLVTGVSPRPTAPRPRQETAKHEVAWACRKPRALTLAWCFTADGAGA